MNTTQILGSLAVGVAIGATTAWFFSKKHYQDEAEARIESMRKEYVDRYEKAKEAYFKGAAQYSEEVAQTTESQTNFRRKIHWMAKELVKLEIKDAEENISPEQFNAMVSRYEQDVEFDEQGEPIWPEPIDSIRKDYISDSQGDDMPKVTKFDWSTLNQNVDIHAVDRANEAVDTEVDISSFTDDNDDDDDEDPDLSEIDREDSDDPYIISRSEFDTEDHFDTYGLTYYGEDGILTESDGDTPVEDEYRIIGDALDHFGEKSDDKDTVYVANPDTDTKYEICRIHGSYSEYVLGVKPEKENHGPLKMRRYDE